MPDLIPPPTAQRPAEVPHLLTQAVSDGDLDAAAALYEPAAVLVLWNVPTATHPAQVRAALSLLLAVKVPLHREPGDVRVARNLAMLTGRWNMRGAGPNLVPLLMFGWQHSVVRRSQAGVWRFLIDRWIIESPATCHLPLVARGGRSAQISSTASCDDVPSVKAR